MGVLISILRNSRYGKCTIVFEWYLPVPLMKDQEHMRGMRKSTIVPNILVEVEIIFSEVSQKSIFEQLID